MKGYERASLRDIWDKKIAMEMDGSNGTINWALFNMDKEYSRRPNESHMEDHVQGLDCMCGNCIDELIEDYYTPPEDPCCLFGDFKYKQGDLEWYFLPHYCDMYSLFIREYLKRVYPQKKIDILYYLDHFICVDQVEKKAYDMWYDMTVEKRKKRYIKIQDIPKGQLILGDIIDTMSPNIELYDIVQMSQEKEKQL